MNQPKKKKDDLIEDFENFLAQGQDEGTNSTPRYFGTLTRTQFDGYLRQLVGHYFETSDFLTSEPVHIKVKKLDSQYHMEILVFTGLFLPSLPSQFWFREGDKKFLFKHNSQPKWEQLTAMIYDNPTHRKLEVQFPIQKIELQLDVVEVNEKETESRFFDSVLSNTNQGEPNLKWLLTESVYQQSREEEIQKISNPETDFIKVRNQNYKINMQNWLNSLLIFTPDQKTNKAEFFVSQFKPNLGFLSQDEVDDLLKPLVKK